jgi:hypothetical protein
MAIEYRAFKQPLNASLIYAEKSENIYTPLRLDENGILKVVSYGTDGTNKQILKTDEDGYLLTKIGFNGTSNDFIKTTGNNRIEAIIGKEDGANFISADITNDGEVKIYNDYLKLPEKKVELFSQTITDSNDILSSNITTTREISLFRIYVSFDTELKLKVKRIRDTSVIEEYLNSAVELTSNSAYMFDILVSNNEEINFIPEIDGSGTTNGVCLTFLLLEKIQVE